MDWNGLLPWFAAAGIMALIVVRAAKRKLANTPPDQLQGVLQRRFAAEMPPDVLRDLLQDQMPRKGYKLTAEADQRLVFDSDSLGLFHWGFLYLFDLPEKAGEPITVSILPKGPNPPRGKALNKHFNEFLANLADLPMKPAD